jgi:hypothetical protein
MSERHISDAQRLKQTAHEESERDDSNWPVAPPSEADLPEGEYIAAYRGFTKRDYFGQAKICLNWEIVEGPCAGMQVQLFATIARKLSRRSKYYGLWVKANGGRTPHGGGPMSPRVFKGYWRVRIAWSVPKNGGHPMPQVVELIERVAGSCAA